MKVSCSNCFAPRGGSLATSAVVLLKNPVHWGFPLFNTTDVALDCKNILVISQNAFFPKGLIIIRFFKSKQSWQQDFQYCWSKMFIPDQNCLDLRSQIQIYSIPDPWSRFQIFPIPDPDSQIWIKELKYFNPKKWFLSNWKNDSGFSSRIWILTFSHPVSQSWIPDPRSWIQGSKRHQIPHLGSLIRICNTGYFGLLWL